MDEKKRNTAAMAAILANIELAEDEAIYLGGDTDSDIYIGREGHQPRGSIRVARPRLLKEFVEAVLKAL